MSLSRETSSDSLEFVTGGSGVGGASPIPPHALLETQTNGSGSTNSSSHTSMEKLDDPPDNHRYENKDSLAHDLSFLATMPELCDVTFLVGDDRQPVCGVRAVLAARSRVFRRMLYGDSGSKKNKKKLPTLRPSDGYIEKYDFKGQVTVIVKDFESEVFKQLVEFIHTGSVILQARTLLGLMNAADHYGLEDLKMACINFMERCVTTDTVCSLLTSAERYIQYKSTKILVQKMFEFVDLNAETILGLGAFSTLPQHVVRIVLGREELHATETSKFEAALRWCVRYCEEHQELTLKEAFEPFVDVIQFYRIPAKHLMKSVKPVEVVDDGIILTALAFQADPKSVEHLYRSQRPRKATMDSPPFDSAPRRFRRVQSSGKTLGNENGNDVVAPASSGNRKVRGGSVPPAGTRTPERKRDRLSSSRGEVHSLKVLDTRSESAESRTSLSTVSLNSPMSPSTDSYQESLSSQGEADSETRLIQASMEPASMEQTTFQPASVEQVDSQQVGLQRTLPYSALDTVVTLSSKAVEV